MHTNTLCACLIMPLFSSLMAYFHLLGGLTVQKMRYWSPNNPKLHQRPLHSPRVMVWWALSWVGIIGPWFIEENKQTVLVNSNWYIMLQEQLWQNMLSWVNWVQQNVLGTWLTWKTKFVNLSPTYPSIVWKEWNKTSKCSKLCFSQIKPANNIILLSTNLILFNQT